jgi:hypothetical protein
MTRKISPAGKKGLNRKKSGAVSYRLKCAKTANGLTHFVMYGDVPKKEMPL